MNTNNPRRGQTLITYALLLALIAFIALAVLSALGGSVHGLFSAANSGFDGDPAGIDGGSAGGPAHAEESVSWGDDDPIWTYPSGELNEGEFFTATTGVRVTYDTAGATDTDGDSLMTTAGNAQVLITTSINAHDPCDLYEICYPDEQLHHVLYTNDFDLFHLDQAGEEPWTYQDLDGSLSFEIGPVSEGDTITLAVPAQGAIVVKSETDSRNFGDWNSVVAENNTTSYVTVTIPSFGN